MARGAPMSPEIARRVVGLFSRFRPSPERADYGLTPHELPRPEAPRRGAQLQERPRHPQGEHAPVAFHVRRIYEKLQVHTKSEAVAKAVRHRLVK